jgi:ketosteroid isomerase-like protein
MVQEPAAPDLVELVRRSSQAASSVEDFVSFLAPDAVFDISPYGMGTYEGLAAIRGFWEGWLDAFEDFAVETGEVLDLGNGVAFSVHTSIGRPHGSSGEIRVPYAIVGVWRARLIERFTMYDDINEARASAERLAESRGFA